MKTEKKRILLVNPRNYTVSYYDFSGEVKFLTKKSGGSVPISLATVAALTPEDFDVKIIDENLESLDMDAHYDLVGITGYLPQLMRMRELAAEFRKRGVPVVLGGMTVTVSPERFNDCADVLIIGEAERIWPQFLKDFLAGSWKREYRETERFDLSVSPVPDFSGCSKEALAKYSYGVVQTSRGCPHHCEFCNVIVYAGRKMRYKPVDTIIREIDQMYRMGLGKSIFLSDDNFSAGRERAKEILRAIRDWNRKQKYPVSFLTQLSIDTARDEEFLKLAAEAGLTSVVVGIETPNEESLKEAGKLHNLKENILENIRAFHRYGIIVATGCMIGFDSDDLSIFRRQVEFHEETGIPIVQVYPLQAVDGTPLKERMIRDGRYIDFEDNIREMAARNVEATLLNTMSIVWKQMTPAQFRQGTCWLLYNLHRPDRFVARFRRFIENYETSPVKDSIDIPPMRLDMEAAGIMFRLIWHMLFLASPEERKCYRGLYSCIRRSSHPQRYGFLFTTFLIWKTTVNVMNREFPDAEKISYPEYELKARIS